MSAGPRAERAEALLITRTPPTFSPGLRPARQDSSYLCETTSLTPRHTNDVEVCHAQVQPTLLPTVLEEVPAPCVGVAAAHLTHTLSHFHSDSCRTSAQGHTFVHGPCDCCDWTRFFSVFFFFLTARHRGCKQLFDLSK